jgi:hypothetical protein
VSLEKAMLLEEAKLALMKLLAPLLMIPQDPLEVHAEAATVVEEELEAEEGKKQQ